MAVTPDNKTTQAAAPTVSREEFDALQDRNTELELQIQELAASLDLVLKAQTAGAGVDPAAASRQALGRTIVQFKENYSRLPQPSTVKDAPNLVEGYTVGAFGVVNLRNDEVARIVADFPDLIETDKSKFQQFPKRTPYLEKDAHGRPVWGSKLELVDVKTLIAKAPNAA